ncbi:hypothetical protein BHU72_10615 [Desulfuribacillus stibiiarsenatis]|uniref:YaaC-like Protein n=1 Tax=Desulfuribacillus stibiiarsenatis TaxID=1390249 RepID=A0A1E5L2U4_9FIRM|nr:YaaC family protein [Desulfuribacillus stibiiarsenatis]OEH84259.1 hypothetical protein BHU72_10615 [Desulfuribacillus stibiiarsenatis]
MKTINRILTEEPYKKMWDYYMYFESEDTVKRFLSDKYSYLDSDTAHSLASQNTPKIIYYIKQARAYYRAAENSNNLVKPLLLYYGMTSLSKALININDPHYPKCTSVLRHGITTRKIKKSHYHFLEDEIKIQREGLFILLNELIGGPLMSSNHKFYVHEMFSLVPEIRDSFERLNRKSKVIPVNITQLYANPTQTPIYISRDILHYIDAEYEGLPEALNKKNKDSNGLFTLPEDINPNNSYLKLIWENKNALHVLDEPLGFNNEYFIEDVNRRIFFRSKIHKDINLPEISVHFILMFILGMLCRYESERWGEIVLSSSTSDMFIINDYLNISMRKYPNLILNQLFDELFVFVK